MTEQRTGRAGEPTGGPTGIGLLMAGGVLLVGYSYLGGLWLNRHGYSPRELVTIREWINQPLALGEDFGLLGCALLLVTAGYLVTGLVLRDGIRSVRTMLLLGYLPIVLAVLADAGLLLIGGHPLVEPATPLAPAEIGQALPANLLLINHISGASALVGLGWVVCVAALHALLMVICLPALRGRAWLAVLGQLMLCGGITVTAATATGAWHRLGESLVLIALPIFGELVWLTRNQRLPVAAGTSIGVVALGLLIYADASYSELTGWWYPMAGLDAVLLLLLAVSRSGGVLLSHFIVRWLASRCYWLFLSLGTVGYAVLGVQYRHVPLVFAYLAAIALTGLGAEAGYRFIQTPCARLAYRNPIRTAAE